MKNFESFLEWRSTISILCNANGREITRCTWTIYCRHFWCCSQVNVLNVTKTKTWNQKYSRFFELNSSSLSVILNSTAGVLLEDICRGCFKSQPSERASNAIVKGSVLALGALSLIFLLVVEKLGGILEVCHYSVEKSHKYWSFESITKNDLILFKVATSLSAIAAGTTFGIFTLGMLVPWSNNFGAICGAISGALMSGWVSFGTQAAIASGAVVPQRLPMSTEGCAGNISSIFTNVEHDESDVFPLYRLSFMWINPSTLNFTSLKFECFFPKLFNFYCFLFQLEFYQYWLLEWLHHT